MRWSNKCCLYQTSLRYDDDSWGTSNMQVRCASRVVSAWNIRSFRSWWSFYGHPAEWIWRTFRQSRRWFQRFWSFSLIKSWKMHPHLKIESSFCDDWLKHIWNDSSSGSVSHIISGFGQQQRGYRKILGSHGPVSDSVLGTEKPHGVGWWFDALLKNPRGFLQAFCGDKNVCCGGDDDWMLAKGGIWEWVQLHTFHFMGFMNHAKSVTYPPWKKIPPDFPNSHLYRKERNSNPPSPGTVGAV